MTKIVAIVGSYRREGITDQAVEAVLGGAQQAGAEVETILLAEKAIEFCTNCRKCAGPKMPELRRTDCIFDDEMNSICDVIDGADGVVLAAPVNFFSVTALMKRFIERLLVYVYWPWGAMMPKPRVTRLDKRAVLITSSACPGWMGRWVMPNSLAVMKSTARLVGAKVVGKLYIGQACTEEHQKLTAGQLKKARSVGQRLAGN